MGRLYRAGQIWKIKTPNPHSVSAVCAVVPLEYRVALFLGLKDFSKLPRRSGRPADVHPDKFPNLYAGNEGELVY